MTGSIRKFLIYIFQNGLTQKICFLSDFKDCTEPALNTVAEMPSIHYRTDHRGKRVIDVDSYDSDLEKFRDEIFHLTDNRGYFERADFDRWWEQLTWHQTDKDYGRLEILLFFGFLCVVSFFSLFLDEHRLVEDCERTD